jgi:hypothetical protein
MHDVTGAALVEDLPTIDLMSKVVPTNDLMPKVESVGEPNMSTDLGAKKSMKTVGTSYETDNTDASNKEEDPVMSDTPQPVTPEPSKVTEEATVEQPEDIKDQKEEKKEELAAKSARPASAPPKYNLNLKNNPRPNRGRVVSLDRARSDASDNYDGYHSPDNERYIKQASGTGGHDSPDSSDDDSSYFASNLPKPKSCRSFSYSSAGSAPAATSSYHQGSIKQESDASLSFSDESDEEMHPNIHISPMIAPAGAVADMHLYPQRITRMHSVSSLISSASSEGHHDGSMDESHHTGSLSSAASTSDPNVRAELQNMAVVNGRSSSGTSEGSGRRSPTMGHPGYQHYGPSSPMGVQSPPPIMQACMQGPGMPHPTPQSMSADQMTAWATAGNAAAQMYPQGQQQYGYGSTIQGMNYAPHAVGLPRNKSESSTLTVPFVYSEDEDTQCEGMFNQMAGSRQAAGGAPAANNDAYPTGINNLRSRQGPSGGGAGGAPQQVNGNTRSAPGQVALAGTPGGGGGESRAVGGYQKKTFKVYWQRWIMLFYMSVLNLLSDWTCYSVAPIALLTKTAFGDIDPEQLVVIFLSANALASACEPIILARLGLRRTVLVGSLMLMIGSVVKSGGIPHVLQANLDIGHEEWRIYLGFFLVGLSQPLYQCTPALLSASWFPEKERTMATGVALNANQLGIGFAFVFGTLLVDDSDDVPGYFGLLSFLATIAFIGTLIQFDDAPPTPPSDTARVMKGSIEVKLPSVDTIVQSVRGFAGMEPPRPPARPNHAQGGIAAAPSPASDPSANSSSGNSKKKSDTRSKKSSRSSSARRGGSTRRRSGVSRTHTANTDNGLFAPSPAFSGSTEDAMFRLNAIKAEAETFGVYAPSPMMPGRVGQFEQQGGEEEGSSLYEDTTNQQEQQGLNNPAQPGDQQFYPPYMGMPGMPPPGAPGGGPEGVPPPFGAFPHPHYQYPYWDPRVQQQMQQQQAMYQQQYQYYQQQAPQPPQPYYYNNMPPYPPQWQNYQPPMHGLPPADYVDEGAEPIITLTDHHLDIEIRDDQVIRSLRACLARPGFIHALVSFTASGIVINTLSTFMDYLVRLNGAPRYYTGIVGGTFQAVIMASSLIVGSLTDKSRAYYSVVIGMLVMGAFGLAECGVSLDANKGSNLRWSLIVVAALVGPLQPVSTELGVDVAYPLSENTVLVIQQLFSNLLSALFIPFFKALKDVGTQTIGDSELYERPEYTFSFYLLIVLHAGATVFFATFNGRYLRFEHELQKKAEEQELEREAEIANTAFRPFHEGEGEYDDSYENERQPLVSHPLV